MFVNVNSISNLKADVTFLNREKVGTFSTLKKLCPFWKSFSGSSYLIPIKDKQIQTYRKGYQSVAIRCIWMMICRNNTHKSFFLIWEELITCKIKLKSMKGIWNPIINNLSEHLILITQTTSDSKEKSSIFLRPTK